MPTFQEDLTVNGDIFVKQSNFVSLHYGNRGRLGSTPSFNPDNDKNGLWLEASADGDESGGLFCNGNTLVLWSPGDNDTLRVYDEDDFATPKLVMKGDGKVGIGTVEPRTPLHVQGRIASGRDFQSAGAVTLYPPDGYAWFHIDNGPAGGRPMGRLRISYGANPGDCEVVSVLQNGTVGIGTSNPGVKFHVNGDRIRLENAGKILDLRADGAAVDLETTTSDLYLRSAGAGHDIVMNPFAGDGNVGIGTGSPQAKLHVQGDVMVSGDIVLQNADCAEEFDLASAEAVEPGTVMVLDEEGRLAQSTQAHDKRVAGVVSGAGDFKPGLVLDRQSDQAGRAAIALIGKVYCKVDAQYAAIEVGDLLTTSPTPGHAMKAADALVAFGAILGKALRPLRSGAGLIPVLVALQ
jgi:hypothetical protein